MLLSLIIDFKHVNFMKFSLKTLQKRKSLTSQITQIINYTSHKSFLHMQGLSFLVELGAILFVKLILPNYLCICTLRQWVDEIDPWPDNMINAANYALDAKLINFAKCLVSTFKTKKMTIFHTFRVYGS